MPTNPPVLVLVDIQEGFIDIDYWGGARNNPDAEREAGDLLARWRANEWPRVHVKHNSTNPASPLVKGKSGNAIHHLVQPARGEPLFEKEVNSAFIGTDLEKWLRSHGHQDLVVVGMTTDHCISTTVRMAGNLGFNTLLVEDATATFDKKGVKGEHIPAQTVHDVSLASLHGEFAEVISKEELLERLGI